MKKNPELERWQMQRRPTHPGEVLLEDVIRPLGMTISAAAKELKISRKTLSELVNGHMSVTAEMAVRIGLWTNTSPEVWLGMQKNLDLWEAKRRAPRNIRAHVAVACKG